MAASATVAGGLSTALDSALAAGTEALGLALVMEQQGDLAQASALLADAMAQLRLAAQPPPGAAITTAEQETEAARLVRALAVGAGAAVFCLWLHRVRCWASRPRGAAYYVLRHHLY